MLKHNNIPFRGSVNMIWWARSHSTF